MKIRILFLFVIVQSMLFDICFAQSLSLDNTTWRVVDFLKLDGVITSPYEKAEKYIGLNITYMKDKIRLGNYYMKIIRVDREQFTEELLWKETAGSGSRGLTFKDFGVKPTIRTIEHINYKCELIGYDATWGDIGTYLVVVDQNTMISFWACHCFVLKRIRK